MMLGWLTILKRNGEESSKFPVSQNATYQFGSNFECQIRFRIADAEYNRYCTLYTQKNRVTLVSVSPVPVYVNNEPIDDRKILRSTDIFRIGNRAFKWNSNTQKRPEPSNEFQEPASICRVETRRSQRKPVLTMDSDENNDEPRPSRCRSRLDSTTDSIQLEKRRRASTSFKDYSDRDSRSSGSKRRQSDESISSDNTSNSDKPEVKQTKMKCDKDPHLVINISDEEFDNSDNDVAISLSATSLSDTSDTKNNDDSLDVCEVEKLPTSNNDDVVNEPSSSQQNVRTKAPIVILSNIEVDFNLAEFKRNLMKSHLSNQDALEKTSVDELSLLERYLNQSIATQEKDINTSLDSLRNGNNSLQNNVSQQRSLERQSVTAENDVELQTSQKSNTSVASNNIESVDDNSAEDNAPQRRSLRSQSTTEQEDVTPKTTQESDTNVERNAAPILTSNVVISIETMNTPLRQKYNLQQHPVSEDVEVTKAKPGRPKKRGRPKKVVATVTGPNISDRVEDETQGAKNKIENDADNSVDDNAPLKRRLRNRSATVDERVIFKTTQKSVASNNIKNDADKSVQDNAPLKRSLRSRSNTVDEGVKLKTTRESDTNVALKDLERIALSNVTISIEKMKTPLSNKSNLQQDFEEDKSLLQRSPSDTGVKPKTLRNTKRHLNQEQVNDEPVKRTLRSRQIVVAKPTTTRTNKTKKDSLNTSEPNESIESKENTKPKRSSTKVNKQKSPRTKRTNKDSAATNESLSSDSKPKNSNSKKMVAKSPKKAKRGRPKTILVVNIPRIIDLDDEERKKLKKRGPPKIRVSVTGPEITNPVEEVKMPKKRGRPKKVVETVTGPNISDGDEDETEGAKRMRIRSKTPIQCADEYETQDGKQMQTRSKTPTQLKSIENKYSVEDETRMQTRSKTPILQQSIKCTKNVQISKKPVRKCTQKK